MRSQAVCAFTGALILVANAGAVLAEQASDKRQPFTKLIAAGFEIRAVTQGPYEIGKFNDAQVYVTLQRGKEVAVCTFWHENWSNMRDESLAQAERCDVRAFK